MKNLWLINVYTQLPSRANCLGYCLNHYRFSYFVFASSEGSDYTAQFEIVKIKNMLIDFTLFFGLEPWAPSPKSEIKMKIWSILHKCSCIIEFNKQVG